MVYWWNISVELCRQLLSEVIMKGCQEFYCGFDLQGGSWAAMNWDLRLYGFKFVFTAWYTCTSCLNQNQHHVHN